jgi:hypothetical protein
MNVSLWHKLALPALAAGPLWMTVIGCGADEIEDSP